MNSLNFVSSTEALIFLLLIGPSIAFEISVPHGSSDYPCLNRASGATSSTGETNGCAGGAVCRHRNSTAPTDGTANVEVPFVTGISSSHKDFFKDVVNGRCVCPSDKKFYNSKLEKCQAVLKDDTTTTKTTTTTSDKTVEKQGKADAAVLTPGSFILTALGILIVQLPAWFGNF